MKAKTIKIDVVKTLRITSYVEYSCPKCYKIIKDYSFDYEKITRFKCSCGQELIAKYNIIDKTK